MANGNYTYNPAEIKDKTVSRMRFELGDTMVEGNSDTAALTDEEIQVAIDSYPKSWKKAKLMLLESLYRRFSYEVDTKTGPLTLNLHDRAVMWKEDYLALKRKSSRKAARFLHLPEEPQINRLISILVCNRMRGRKADD